MYRTSMITHAILIWAVASPVVLGQAFNSGSDGSYGPIEVTEGTVTLDMPTDGIFHATTITVHQGAVLLFNRNSLNTPVYLLATGDINIQGTISVGGGFGTSVAGGLSGPGGFDGGNPGLDPVPPGDGHGPGAGLAGRRGAYGAPPLIPIAMDGVPYGGPLLFPLIGGSGGGGTIGQPGCGGGGGGGAILLASNTRVAIQFEGNTNIGANGGYSSCTCYSGGSGGAIRIVAPIVGGTGRLRVRGGCACGFPPHCPTLSRAGPGRIRIDTLDRAALNYNFQPNYIVSVGSFMRIFPTPLPRLDVVHVAGQDIPEGEPEPVIVELPFGSPTSQLVTVQARNFTGILPIEVVVTPEHGPSAIFLDEIDMSAVTLGEPGQATVTVEIPVNTPTRIAAWVR